MLEGDAVDALTRMAIDRHFPFVGRRDPEPGAALRNDRGSSRSDGGGGFRRLGFRCLGRFATTSRKRDGKSAPNSASG
jgi:hypothetical protein